MIPKSHKNKAKRNVRIASPSKVLILSDIHIPYHDIDALLSALEHGKKAGVDNVVLMGDTMDCHLVSTHRKSKDAPDLVEEIYSTHMFLRHLRSQFKKADIYMMEGNHELRLQRYIEDNADQLVGITALKLDRLLGLDDLGIQWLTTGQLITAGNMTLLHGHEFSVSGINPARKLFMKTKLSSMCGHLHRPDTFFTRNARGEGIECHVVGTLGELHPDYAPKNDWQHGYAILDVKRNGKFKVNNVRL
jgi:predicted phosphodiesterase